MQEGGGRWVGNNKLVELKKKKRIDILSMGDFKVACISYLENIGSLCHVDLPCIEIAYHTISKNHNH